MQIYYAASRLSRAPTSAEVISESCRTGTHRVRVAGVSESETASSPSKLGFGLASAGVSVLPSGAKAHVLRLASQEYQ